MYVSLFSPTLGSQTGESSLFNPNPESVWGPPRMLLPEEPMTPAKLRAPDHACAMCKSYCADLKAALQPG